MAYSAYFGGRLWGRGMTAVPNDATVPMETWAIGYMNDVQEAFNTGGHGSRGGPQWLPWAESTRQGRERRLTARQAQDVAAGGILGKLLIDSTRLRGKITFAKPEIAGSVVTVAIGSNVPYFGVHQWGAPSRNIPARPIVFITGSDRQKIRATFRRWLRVQVGAMRLHGSV